MAHKVHRRRVIGGIGAAGALTLAGCLGDDDPVGDDDDDVGDDDDDDDVDAPGTDPDERDVMHGILQPETGDLGELGPAIADAAELPSIQLANEGSPVTVDVAREDTETLSEAGISRAEDLAAGGYPSFTGAAASDVSIPVSDVAINNEMVMISPASTAPAITDIDGRWVLRTCPSDALQGGVMAELAWDDQGWESAGTLHLNDAYGQALNDVFVEEFEDLGGEVMSEVPFEPEQPSYTSEIESAIGDEPDFLMIVAFPESGIQMFRDFYGEGYDLPVMVTDGLIEDGLPDSVDNPMDNVIGTSPAADGPELDAFNELYEDEYGAGPGVFNAHAYDASAVQILANLRAGDNDGSAVADQIRPVTDPGGEVVGPSNFAEGCELAADGEEIEYQGASSPVVFDENGDMTVVAYDIWDFADYELSVTETIEFED